MSKIDEFLSRLSKVRKTGPETWTACCPSHEDKHPSLGVRLTADGTMLVICRSGMCDIDEIARAVGMELTDFFPEKLPAGKDFARPLRRPFPAADVLEALAFEADVLAVVAADIAAGKEISEGDRRRMLVCAQRIREARRITLG